jgi:hypothetical protein
MATKPFIAFKNYIDFFDPDDKVPPGFSATSEQADYPAANIANWRLDGESRWKASSKVAQFIYMDYGAGNAPDPDTMVISGHNTFNEPVKHGLWYSDTSLPGEWVEKVAYQNAPSNHPMATTFAQDGGHQYWGFQLEDTTGDLLEVGNWFLGLRLEFPVGIQPGLDYHSASPNFYHDSPINGSPIGRAVSHLDKSIRLDWQTPGFLSKNILDFFPYATTTNYDVEFLAHLATGSPFWFVPDYDNDRTHVYLSWADGFSTPFDGSIKRRTFSGTINCFKEVF